MAIDIDLYLDIVNITKKEYDNYVLPLEENKVLVKDVKQILKNLVEVKKEG